MHMHFHSGSTNEATQKTKQKRQVQNHSANVHNCIGTCLSYVHIYILAFWFSPTYQKHAIKRIGYAKCIYL